MRFHIAAVDLAGLGAPPFLGQGRQDTVHAASAPAVPAIVDGRRGIILARAVGSATAALQHVHDTRYHPSVIDPPGPRLVLRQVRLDRRPRRIRQPKQRSRHAQTLLNWRLLNQHAVAESSF